MGKRYYCDYCDRSFADDVQARKKHLQSSSHVRNYRQHYQKLRDLKAFIEEEEKKEECYKFLNSGVCAFGENCYRSHFGKHRLNVLRNQLQGSKEYQTMRDIAQIKTVDSWLQKRNGGIMAFDDLTRSQSGSLISSFNSFYPNYLSYIPPSLQNVRVTKPTDIQFADWG